MTSSTTHIMGHLLGRTAAGGSGSSFAGSALPGASGLIGCAHRIVSAHSESQCTVQSCTNSAGAAATLSAHSTAFQPKCKAP